MRRRNVIAVLVVCAVVGLGLRYVARGAAPLWQDEGETVINALQVLDHGYPSSEYEGKPLFENPSFLPSSDPKYEYVPTNYSDGVYERNKGWLTFYYLAPFLKLFGFSTLASRLPFLLLFLPSLFLVFHIGRKLFSVHVGLIAAALYAVNGFSIYYERFARYYILVVLFSLCCLLWIYLAATRGRWRDFLFVALGLVLLFHTHALSAVIMTILFALTLWYAKGRIFAMWSRRSLVVYFCLLACALPWVLLVRAWVSFGLLNSFESRWVWGVILCTFVGAFFLARRFVKVLVRVPLVLPRFSPLPYCALAAVLVVVVKPLLMPAESIGARAFIEINAIVCVLLAAYVRIILQKKLHAEVRDQAVFFLGVTVSILVFCNVFEPFRPINLRTNWFTPALGALQQKGVSPETPVLVSYQQFPLMLYSDYNVDLMWPIHKQWYDAYPGEMVFLVYGGINKPAASMFYERRILKTMPGIAAFPFYDRLQTCTPETVAPLTTIYWCPALPRQ